MLFSFASLDCNTCSSLSLGSGTSNLMKGFNKVWFNADSVTLDLGEEVLER